jgi:hypothetical protein
MHAAYLRIFGHFIPELVFRDIHALMINIPNVMIRTMLLTFAKPIHEFFVVYDCAMLEE